MGHVSVPVVDQSCACGARHGGQIGPMLILRCHHLLRGQGREDCRGRLAHQAALIIVPRTIVRVVDCLVVGRSGTLPHLKVLEGASARRGRHLGLHRLEHDVVRVGVELQLGAWLLLELLLFLLLLFLLEHDHVSMMLLLLLHCGRLLCILDGSAPVAELEADLLWHLDRHRAAASRIILSQVGSLRADLLWGQARQVGLHC